mmetsp:Transcript_25576/g.64552  ORF Transcript_25576/g.64552 Transcript_25576/m.64552 type:complete len:149 (-) Transcript_25576:237-683(-)
MRIPDVVARGSALACSKKYVIEVLQGEKIVSRKKGFTVTTCVSAVAAADETPAFNSLPVGEKIFQAPRSLCVKQESQDLPAACATACSSACDRQLDAYNEATRDLTGLALGETDKSKMAKAGSRRCNYECTKQGASSTFVVPSRNFVR